MRVLSALSVMILAMFATCDAFAINSKAETREVLRDLMAWLPGEYSSAPQIFYEREAGAPPDGEHENFYRVFAKIDAPQLGENVIYTQIRIGGKDGPIFSGQQVLFLITVDDEHRAVTVSGRRIADPDKFEDAHLHPEMWAAIAPDPDYGGNCDFRWRKHGDQIVGKLTDGKSDTTCTMISKRSGTQYTWDAEWILNDHELWIFDNGYLDDGSLFSGRADRTHLRMYKSRPFECFAAYRPQNGEPQVFNGIAMHDRGDVHAIEIKGIEGPVYMQLMRSMWPSESGKNYADLLRLDVFQGEPETSLDDRKLIGFSWASADSDRTGFDIGTWGARCKLAK
ncbi:MAG: hypothetical protein KDE14_12520 [Rhodobacteraceae bacterium]|nr:hypothetical protein [Paracoccaceae bacterium]